MKYTLKELLDIPRLHELLDSLDEVQSLPSAIIDNDGKILTATSWQKICTDFHRINPETQRKCIESDKHIEAQLGSQVAPVIYRCPMGLIDAAMPIVIEEQHLGNVFTGQHFLGPPDKDVFIKQAKRYGFAEKTYLAAMQKVPIITEGKLRTNLKMIHHLVQILVEQGLQCRRQAEAETELRKSTEKYRQIFENLQEVYYETSLQGMLLEISPSVSSLSQYTREELIGSSLSELYYDTKDREKLLEQVLASGQVKDYKIYLKDKDGSKHLCAVTTSIIKDNKGVPLKIVGAIRDISEAERIEEALRIQVGEYESSQKLLKESEERFKALHDASFGGVAIHDNGLILDCNQGLSEITGFSSTELIGMDGLKLIASDSLDTVLKNIKSGYAKRYEVKGVRKDGSIYPLSIRGKNVQYRGNQARVIEFRDLTDIKLAEEGLRKSEAKQRAMLENIIDVVAIVDKKGINRFKSPNVERWFGWTPEELVGKPVLENVHPDDQQNTKMIFGQLSEATDSPTTAECRYRCKDGQYKWIEFTGVNRFHDEDIAGILISYHDIGERKELEKEKAKTDKMESIGILAGGIAHDFNNILAALFGNIALAKLKLSKEHPGFRFIEAAEKSMNRATLLTNQLLTFAKGGAPVRENLDLNDLIEDIVSFNLSGSNVKPNIKHDPNLWQANVDPGQTQQVFSNLTINALQAMPDGGHLHINIENIEIESDVLPGLETGTYLRITFADEGAGIKEKLLPRIFDPYFSTKKTGSGLGLATIYSIVNKHGGQIEVTSQLGQGTVFTLYLPASRAQPISSYKKMAELPVHKSDARILLMDDEENIRSTISEMLNEIGLQVETAAEGKQALEIYQQALEQEKPFNLALLDLTIPGGMGGLEAAKRILELDPHANLIVSSGYAEDPIMSNYAEYGFKGVLTKPYNFESLSATLAKLLSE